VSGPAQAQSKTAALREMQIHAVPELGLRIWVENQPPWQGALDASAARPTFTVQSPDNYHPPSAMTYQSWPTQRLSAVEMQQVAGSAIQRAGQNFGLDLVHSRGIQKLPAIHGIFSGLEGQFTGSIDGVPADVRIFVGHVTGKFPVALSVYTLEGKMVHLAEVVRRSWGNLSYLSA
jgi:hypothetical protein